MPEGDIRDLIGRYATGSLTESERAKLFEAALSDQELFDQLAREQRVKDVLDQPGARERLIHSLTPPARKRWLPTVIAVSALIAAGTSIVVLALHKRYTQPPIEVAMTKVAEQPPAAVDAMARTAASPTPGNRPVQAKPLSPVKKVAQAPPETVAQSDAAKPEVSMEPRKTETAAAPVSAPAPIKASAPPALSKEKDQAVSDQTVVEAQNQLRDAKQQVQVTPSPYGQQANQAGPEGAIANTKSSFAPQAPAAAAGGGASVARAKATLAAQASAVQTSKMAALPLFGFRYAVNDGQLTITPAADGYLAINSGEKTLFQQAHASAGLAVSVPITGDLQSAVISFSRLPNPPRKDAVPHQGLSGTVQDLNPSAESVLVISISLKREQ